MNRKSGVIGVLVVAVAAIIAVIATTATASSSRPAAKGSADTALLTCGKTRSIGLLAPITGPAASLGAPQVNWVEYYVKTYNAKHKKKKFKLVKADTILGGPGGTAEAVKAAQSLGSDVLGVVGPAGSNEVKATTATLKNAGLAFVSGSATNTTITTDGTRRGFFYRTVPPDAQQSKDVTHFLTKKLKVTKAYIIDDQEAYSTGLADEVQSQLRAAGVSVGRDGVSQQQSDFSSLIAKIPRDTQVVYLPWQLPPKGKAFGEQMRSAGKGSIKLMGSDGLFDPAFASVGKNVYDSFFPVQISNKIVKAYRKAHSGKGDYFGAPSYVSAQVVGGAIDRACKNGTASRAEVRAQVQRTKFKTSLLGIPISFDRNGDIRRKKFGIFHSSGSDFVGPIPG